tara:strand:+ start:488 stop:682 length:195 start_codon:yes stop_codon:yes gene_type:complete
MTNEKVCKVCGSSQAPFGHIEGVKKVYLCQEHWKLTAYAQQLFCDYIKRVGEEEKPVDVDCDNV